MISKKAQVDVALTIGAIIIPVAVLFGALIFAWAMISPVTDAGRTAGLVMYDMGAMTDIVYSVPDSIRLVYSPPSMCSMEKDIQGASIISCFSGFMNFSSSINVHATTVAVEFPTLNDKGDVEKGLRDIPLEAHVNSSIIFSKEILKSAKLEDKPIDVEYSAFANLNDFDLIHISNYAETYLQTDKGIVFEKHRSGMEDTIVPESLAVYDKDPLAEIVSNSAAVCNTGSTITKDAYLKPGFYLRQTPGSNELCLYKAMIFPDVTKYMTSYSPTSTYYCTGWSATRGTVYLVDQHGSTTYDYTKYDVLSGEKYTENKISCFIFNSTYIPGGCTYDMSYWGSNNDAYSPAGADGTHITFDIAKTGSTISYSERTD